VILAPVVALAGTSANARVGRQVQALAGDVAHLAAPGDRIFVLAASDPMVSMYPPGVLVAGSREWAASCWSVASAAKATHRVTRTGAATLELETVDATMLTGPFETLYRGDADPMHDGDSAHQCGATYRVLEARGGRPVRIELAVDVPLEDPHVRLVAWQAGGLAPVALPKVGDAVALPWSPGPIGIF
jgi:hypothetical protein